MKIAAVYLACCAVWGSTWSVIAVGLRDLPPFLFAGSRMVLAGLLLAPFAWREARARGTGGVARLGALGLLQIAVPYGAMFFAQQWTPSALTAVLFATYPIWVALLGQLVLRERLTRARVVAVALGVAGVAVLQGPRLAHLDVSGALAGASLLVVLASISSALSNVLLKRRRAAWTPAYLTSVQALTSGAALLVLSGLLERGRAAAFTPSALGAIAYLAVFATVLTYLGLYWLLPRVPLVAIGTIPLLDTTVAFTIAAGVLHERLGPELWLGGALVLASAAIANLAPAAPPAQARGAARAA